MSGRRRHSALEPPRTSGRRCCANLRATDAAVRRNDRGRQRIDRRFGRSAPKRAGRARAAAGRNLGFAAAVNRGIEAAASGLDRDPEQRRDAGCLVAARTLLTAAERGDAWFATGKILRAGDPAVIDGTFDEISRGRLRLALRVRESPIRPVWNQPAPIRFAPDDRGAVPARPVSSRSACWMNASDRIWKTSISGCAARSPGAAGVYVPGGRRLSSGQRHPGRVEFGHSAADLPQPGPVGSKALPGTAVAGRFWQDNCCGDSGASSWKGCCLSARQVRRVVGCPVDERRESVQSKSRLRTILEASEQAHSRARAADRFRLVLEGLLLAAAAVIVTYNSGTVIEHCLEASR